MPQAHFGARSRCGSDSVETRPHQGGGKQAARPLTSARTVATTVLVGFGLYLVIVLESTSRLREAAVGALCVVLVGTYALVLLLPAGRRFFELAAPGITILVTAAAGIVLAAAGLWLVDERFVPMPASVDPSPNP
jgi:hypothetical protein